jgi:hypothetical protein
MALQAEIMALTQNGNRLRPTPTDIPTVKLSVDDAKAKSRASKCCVMEKDMVALFD